MGIDEKRIIRPQDYDAVLFMGENNMELKEFRLLFPSTTPGFSCIIYNEGTIKGKEKTVTGIKDDRILKRMIMINGKRALPVACDINAVDVNRSFLDFFETDLQLKLDNEERKNSFLKERNRLLTQFLEDQGMETTWEEWLINKLELLRVADTKRMGKPVGEAPTVGIEVKEEKKIK